MKSPNRFGKYLLLDRISVGGMAEVYQAKSFGPEGFAKTLAIKQILPTLAEDQEFIQMFIDEARIAGQLSHPNICEIYELGRINNAYFIAMEYVWGKDLLQIQNRFRRLKRRMPLSMAAFVAAKICDALDYAHRKRDAQGKPLNIVHRDVSPQNILISYDGDVKVIDFGIAKAVSRSSRTQAGVLKGKFGYMSPEQVRGLPLDRRSDIFAIGTVLYELCTGERLFTGDSDFAVLDRVRNADVHSPRQVNPLIPLQLEAVIMKALQREIEDRYVWTSDMRDDLLGYLRSSELNYSETDLSVCLKDLFEKEREKEAAALDSHRNVSHPDMDHVITSERVINRSGESASPHIRFSDPGGDEERTTPIGSTTSDFHEATEMDGLTPSGNPTKVAESTDSTSFGDDDHSGIGHTDDFARSDTIAVNPVAKLQSNVTPMPSAANPSVPKPPLLMPLPQPPISAPLVNPLTPTEAISRPIPITGMPRAVRVKKRGQWVAPFVFTITVVLVAIVLWAAFRPRPSVPLGSLVVSATATQPASIFVNGKEMGTLQPGRPLTLKELASGQHHLAVLLKDGTTVTKTVNLARGEVKVVMVEVPIPKSFGHLLLTVTPSKSRVFIDDVEASSQALSAPLQLTSGRAHQVRVTSPGYESVAFEVQLTAGEQLSRNITLKEIRSVNVLITSTPVGAMISLQGQAKGNAPVSLSDVEPGRYRVTASMAGYESESQSLTVVAKRLSKLHLVLKPVEEKSTRRVTAQHSGRSRVRGGGDGAKPPPPSNNGTNGDGSTSRDPAETGNGFLVANTTPWAKVLVDNQDTGKTTPIVPRAKLSLTPGRHVVTFVAGGKKFSYTVVIQSGQTTKLIKDLPIPAP